MDDDNYDQAVEDCAIDGMLRVYIDEYFYIV